MPNKALQPTVLPPLRYGKRAAELGRYLTGPAAMSIKIRARSGLLSAAKIQEIASKCARKLRDRKDYDWLAPNCIETEIDNLPFSFSKSLRCVMCREVSGKVSTFLLKRVAKSLQLNLRGNRAVDVSVFLVHDFMFPWYLFQEHAGHLRHPQKKWHFWYAKQHREWVNREYGVNGLEPGFLDSFEEAYSDWIECGWVKQISHAVHPLQAKAYRVVNVR